MAGARVRSVRHLGGHRLAIEFADGSGGEIDFAGWLTGRGGVFAAFEEEEFFRQVRVDEEAGTLVWPNGVDLCPDVLRHRATGAALPGRGRSSAA